MLQFLLFGEFSSNSPTACCVGNQMCVSFLTSRSLPKPDHIGTITLRNELGILHPFFRRVSLACPLVALKTIFFKFKEEDN